MKLNEHERVWKKTKQMQTNKIAKENPTIRKNMKSHERA